MKYFSFKNLGYSANFRCGSPATSSPGFFYAYDILSEYHKRRRTPGDEVGSSV